MNKTTKLYGLDHLRALAILLVFLYHYGRIFSHPQWVNTICTFGWTGVDLFFVLSGYLITSQLLAVVVRDNEISFRRFYLKRFFRIIPAYLVVVALYFCFPYFRERGDLAPLWKYLTFTQNLGLDLRTQGTFSHAWSLCIEEQFYLCLPLMLAALLYFKILRKGVFILIALFMAGFVARYYSYQAFVHPFINADDYGAVWYKFIYYPTYCRLDGLLCGVAVATIFRYAPGIREWIEQRGNAMILMGIAVLTGAYFLTMEQESFAATMFGFPLVSIGYAVIVAGAISPASFLFRFNAKITTLVATLSYSLYLVHKFVIHITQDQLSKTGIDKESTLMFFICIAACLCCAYIMNRVVERPFLRLRDKMVK